MKLLLALITTSAIASVPKFSYGNYVRVKGLLDRLAVSKEDRAFYKCSDTMLFKIVRYTNNSHPSCQYYYWFEKEDSEECKAIPTEGSACEDSLTRIIKE